MKKYNALQFKILRFQLVSVLGLNQKGGFGRTLHRGSIKQGHIWVTNLTFTSQKMFDKLKYLSVAVRNHEISLC